MILEVKSRKWEPTFSISKTLSSSTNQLLGCSTPETRSINPCSLQSVSLRHSPSSSESDMPQTCAAKFHKIPSWPRWIFETQEVRPVVTGRPCRRDTAKIKVSSIFTRRVYRSICACNSSKWSSANTPNVLQIRWRAAASPQGRFKVRWASMRWAFATVTASYRHRLKVSSCEIITTIVRSRASKVCRSSK